MVPGYEIQTISSGGRSQNSCPTKLEEQSNCIARIFIILYNQNKAPLKLGFAMVTVLVRRPDTDWFP